jgi:hypothetical protein
VVFRRLAEIKGMYKMRKIFLIPAISLIAFYSYSRGVITGVQVWGEPYLVVNYSDGFIKRGLLGHFLSFFYHRADLNRLHAAGLALHWILSSFIIVFLAVWIVDTSKQVGPPASRAIIGLFAVFATSQFLPTLALITCYLDVYLTTLLLIGAAAWISGVWWLAIVVGAIGPIIHESFIFLWSTLAVIIFGARLRQGRVPTLREVSIIAAPIIVTVFVLLGHSQNAAQAQMARAPLSDMVKRNMIATQFGQKPVGAFLNMLNTFSLYPVNFIVSALYFTPPAIVIIGVYAWLRALSLREMAIIILATIAPLSVLLVAWDLSRFLVWSNLAAILSVLLWEDATTPTTSRKLPLTPLLLFAGLLAVLPFVYAYFPWAQVIDQGPFPLRRSFIGRPIERYFQGPYSHH